MPLSADTGTLRGTASRRAGRGAVVALCLLTAFALAACNTRRGQTVPVASAADLPAETVAAGTPGGDPTRTAALVPAAASTNAMATPAPDGFEIATPADPDEVMGLGRNAVQALLGQPGLVRREAPAEVWQYHSDGCVLDVFLYQASADFEVVYLEARNGQAATAATATCLGSVLEHRRRTPSS